jgi:outer membrane protein OmpA-like peptidoglycan-associated protein
VSLQLQKDVLVASGTAPIDWIDTSLRIAPVIPGVLRLDAGALIDSSLDALARSIEAAIPMFIKGSTEFSAGGEQIVHTQLGRLTSLDALGRVAKRQFTVELIGEADADGAPELNLPLSERRAARVLSLLQAQPLEHVTFSAIGVGSREKADPGAGEEKKQRNRRVSFRITSADRR